MKTKVLRKVRLRPGGFLFFGFVVVVVVVVVFVITASLNSVVHPLICSFTSCAVITLHGGC